MEKNDNYIFSKEEKYLDRVNEGIENEIAEQRKELKEIPKKHTNVLQGDTFLVESLMNIVSDRLYHLEKNADSPYFGKIVFTDKDGQNEEIYIGKNYFYDKNKIQVVNDWRSPVCSIYYDSEIGPTSYKSPSGIIKGNLSLKRQFIIKNKKLEKYFDSSLVTNDEILRHYLDTHADNKMKDIIASIQKEQNDIIRKPINSNIIVQGIAGSGKTSVALHRIAYLIYYVNELNRKENKIIKANQFTIIGPNSYFLDYISEVLPDMDVENANQETIVSLTNEILKEKIKIDNNKTKNNNIKASANYLKALSLFLNDYINNNLNKSFMIDDAVIFDSEFIKKYFKYHNYIQEAINNFIDIYSKKIREEHEYYETIVNKSLRMKMKSLEFGSNPRELILNEIQKNEINIKKGLKNELKEFFKDMLASPVVIYKEFINNIDKYMEVNNITEFKQENINNLNKKIVSTDDLAPLIYIKSMFSNIKKYKDTVHVVIDEAQDLSINEFIVLKKIFPMATFSIFGDLNQSIYANRSIDSWDKVGKMVFNSDYELLNLNQSYRTTDEIIKEANKVSNVLTGNESRDNVRHGEPVKYTECAKKDLLTKVLLSVEDMLKNGCKTIAIITKTNKEANELNKKLEKKGLNVKNIGKNDETFYVGICTIASYLSKGLEFDGAILYNVNSENYDVNNSTDMALLYVEMTRPLHRLDIIYEGILPEILLTNKNIKRKIKQR